MRPHKPNNRLLCRGWAGGLEQSSPGCAPAAAAGGRQRQAASCQLPRAQLCSSHTSHGVKLQRPQPPRIRFGTRLSSSGTHAPNGWSRGRGCTMSAALPRHACHALLLTSFFTLCPRDSAHIRGTRASTSRCCDNEQRQRARVPCDTTRRWCSTRFSACRSRCGFRTHQARTRVTAVNARQLQQRRSNALRQR